MSFTPTKEQLEELGFKDTSYKVKDVLNVQFSSKKFDYGQSQIIADFRAGWVVFELYVYDQDNDTEQFTRLYPKSLEDLKNLIRYLTPPWA